MPPGPDVPFLKRDMERGAKMFTDGLIAQNARDDAEKNYRPGRAETGIGEGESVERGGRHRQSSGTLSNNSRPPFPSRKKICATRRSSRPSMASCLSRDSEVGDAVSSILLLGSSATLIMTVGDLNEVYIKGKVDESDIGKVYLGQPARITVESFKEQKFPGRVTKNSPMGAEKDNVTTFEVRVSISNEKHILKAQMTANAEIILDEHKGVLAIPEGAVTYNKDKSTAVQIPDPTNEKGFRKVAITTGISNGAKTEIAQRPDGRPASHPAIAMTYLSELVSQVAGSLLRNKLRSFLTMAGIAWGITSIVLIVAMGDGFKAGQQNNMKGLGENIVILFGGRTELQAGGERAGRRVRLNHADVENLRREAYLIKIVAAELEGSVHATSPYNSGSVRRLAEWKRSFPQLAHDPDRRWQVLQRAGRKERRARLRHRRRREKAAVRQSQRCRGASRSPSIPFRIRLSA